jgi:mono/diheme cytochrome c family protein
MKMFYSAALAAVIAVGFVGTSAEAQEDKKTARTWKAKCGSCHGTDGAGDTTKGKAMKVPDMTSAKWQASKTDAEIAKAINETAAVEVDGKKDEVHGFKDEMDAAQVDAMVKFIRGMKK